MHSNSSETIKSPTTDYTIADNTADNAVTDNRTTDNKDICSKDKVSLIENTEPIDDKKEDSQQVSAGILEYIIELPNNICLCSC